MGQIPDDMRGALAAMGKQIQREREFEDGPPDGMYQAIVKEFDFITRRDGSETFLKTVLTIDLDPQWKGCDIETMHSLTNTDRAASLMKHLTGLGCASVDLQNIDTAPELRDALDCPVVVAIKRSDRINPQTDKPYVGVYVNERLGGPIPSDLDMPAPVPSPGYTDDDIAF